MKGRGPAFFVLSLGYAGWALGSLEGELEAGAWAVISATHEVVFGDDDAGKWQRAYDQRRLDL
ncbi:MAG: hypothetical protein EXQ85_04365 [Alphaproteobacteria bacterium]|nr:hypothetical protein [Alphaproteobacteria bacterium]